MTTFNSRQGAATPLRTGGMDGRAADTADAAPFLIHGPDNGQPADTDLVFTFSEPIQAGSGKVTLDAGYSSSPVFTANITDGAVQISGSTATLHLPQHLAYATSYHVTFDANAIHDLAGHALSAASTVGFTSGLSPVAVYLTGTNADDTLQGSDLGDTLNGSPGNDTLLGGDGADVLTDGDGANLLDGGAGDDHLLSPGSAAGGFTTHGDTTLDGGAGNDTIMAANADDVVRGGTGDDNIWVAFMDTTPRHVTVDGGDGNDVILVTREALGVTGTVEATGGAGRDTYRWSVGQSAPGALTVKDFQAGAGGDVLDVLSLLYGTTQNPFATGHVRLVADGADTLLQVDPDGTSGSSGFVTAAVLKGVLPAVLTSDNFTDGISPDGSSTGLVITGTDGADWMHGGVLDDTIHGGGGNDTIDGGPGANQIFGGDGNDALTSWASGDTLSGDAGNDLLTAQAGDNVLDGGDGKDVLSAYGYGNHVLIGGAGNDNLGAGDGNATIDGGAGNDLINIGDHGGNGPAHRIQADGGDGNDTFYFLAGGSSQLDVVAHGGAGRDTFIVDAPLGNTMLTLTGFETRTNGDVVDLGALLRNQVANPFAPDGPLRVVTRGADAVLQIDLDGTGPGGFADLLTFKDLAKSSLGAANFWNGFNPDGSNRGYALVGTDQAGHLRGGYLDDTLTGGAGNDTLEGAVGNDSLVGGAGDDTLIDDNADGRSLSGARFDDYLSGGAGNDVLTSLYGNDTLDGGTGDDELTISGHDAIAQGTREMVVANGGDGADRIAVFVSGADLDLQLSGGAGRDHFTLRLGLPPQHGTITITDFTAGAGGDKLDPLVDQPSPTAAPFTSGLYRFEQRGADSVLEYNTQQGWQDMVVLKNVQVSTLTADNVGGGYDPAGSNPASATITVEGGASDDWLSAGDRSAAVHGGAGNDHIDIAPQPEAPDAAYHFTVDGGDGNDTITLYDAASTRDTFDVSGGAGSDVFRFSATHTTVGTITIKDFQAGPGGDVLDVLSLFLTAPTSNPFAPGQSLRAVQDGADTLIKLLAGPTDMEGTTLVVLQNVSLASLTGDNFPLGIHPDGSTAGLTLQGTAGNDQLRGNLLDDTIHGGDGDDVLDGAGGVNTLYGDGGNDTLTGGGHGDHLYGGSGQDSLVGHDHDYLDGGADADTLQVYGDAAHLDGGDGADAMLGEGNNDTVIGGAGNDSLHGVGFGNSVDGGSGDDDILVITNDAATPGSGTVQVEGGDGNDTVELLLRATGPTEVTAHGGAGSDKFIVGELHPGALVTITDFQPGAGGDSLDLGGIARWP